MKLLTIAEIERQLENVVQENDPFLLDILHDERKGVQQLVHKWKKKLAENQRLKEKFVEMSSYEHKGRNRGYELIAGVDEVGRGPLAGPVVVQLLFYQRTFF